MRAAITLAAVTLLGALSACAHRQTIPTNLPPGPQGNGGLFTAAPISRGSTTEGNFPCQGSMYFRLDGQPEGTVLDISLQTRVMEEPAEPPLPQPRFCHRGAFPDGHDQYTYTALGGCPDAANPASASSAPTTESGPFYIRLWRLQEESGGRCVAARYSLSVR